MSRLERTGWRDEALSKRHRLWGFDCPAVDVDFLVVEYDTGEPAALIDYKHWERAQSFEPDANMAAFGRLYNAAGEMLPAFYVRYGGQERAWRRWAVRPVNAAGRAFLKSGAVEFEAEADFVAFLYRLRGREVPAGVLEVLRWLALVERAAGVLRLALRQRKARAKPGAVLAEALAGLMAALKEFEAGQEAEALRDARDDVDGWAAR